MGHRERAVAWALLGIALGAHGQGTPPAPAPAAAAAPDKSASAAAMERARRLAEGPMRVILEAGKSRRRPVEPEAPAAAGPAAGTAAAPRPAATPAAPSTPAPALAALAPVAAATGPATTRSLVPPTSAAPAAAPAPSSPPAPAAAPATTPAPASTSSSTPTATSAVETRLTLESPALLNRTPVPVVDTLQPAGTVAPLAVETPSAVAALPLSARPRLLSMPEPDLPQRVLDELGRNASVLVDLTIQPDGRVSALVVLPPAPRQMQRLLEATLRDWRFAPLPAERVHRIELVFNNN